MLKKLFHKIKSFFTPLPDDFWKSNGSIVNEKKAVNDQITDAVTTKKKNSRTTKKTAKKSTTKK